MRALEEASGKFQKKTKDSKVFIQPLCAKQRGQERPTQTLGGKPIQYKEEAVFLGATLQQKLDGGRKYIENYRVRARQAEEKVRASRVLSGPLVRADQTKLYYDAIVLSTTNACLSTTRLMDPDGGVEESLHG